MRREQDALGELLDHLRDFVERIREFLDVLALQRRNEGGIDGVADLPGNLFVLAARIDEIVHDHRLIEVFAQLDKRLDAGARLLGTGFEQVEELVFFTQQLLK